MRGGITEGGGVHVEKGGVHVVKGAVYLSGPMIKKVALVTACLGPRWTIIVLIARTPRMPDLGAYALRRLKFQLHTEARQLIITKASRSYLQVPQLAQALRGAREVEDFAIDLVETLGNVHRQLEDWALTPRYV